MILKVTAGQAGRVRKLARGKCCNCVDGNCLLLDDGGENRCVQFISRYGVIAPTFSMRSCRATESFTRRSYSTTI